MNDLQSFTLLVLAGTAMINGFVLLRHLMHHDRDRR